MEFLRMFQGSFEVVYRMFQRKLKECFKEDSGVFQLTFREVPRVFQECFKGVSR